MKLSMIIKKVFLCAAMVFVLIAPASLVFAQAGGVVNTEPVPLKFAPPCVPVSGISGLDTCASPLTSASTIQDYLIRLYQFAVGISGIVAVGMIVWGAIKISALTESVTQKSEGRDMITSAVIGVVLLFGSYLILRTINPRIVALGEMLSSSTIPTNATSGITLAAPASCGDASSTQGLANGWIGNSSPVVNNTCRYRKLYIVKDGLTITRDAQFYDGAKTIAPGSVIWVYPYMLTGEPTSTAKCVIYAYREPGEDGATFSSLKSTIEPCILDKRQEDGYAGGPLDLNARINSGGNIATPEQIKTLANSLDNRTGSVSFSANASCQPSDSSASGVLAALKKGVAPYVCSNGCSSSGGAECKITGVYPSYAILGALLDLNSSGLTATVTSLTGGDHSTNSPHYTGNAVDLVAGNTPDKDYYNKVITRLNTPAGSYTTYAYCEYKNPSGVTELHNTCGTAAFASGVTNLHIHAQTSPNSAAVQ